MSWYRPDLVDKGILFDSQLAKDGQCPSHVESLRACVLDFSCPLPSVSRSSTLDSLLEDVQAGRNVDDPTIDLAKEIQQEATRLCGGFSELQWSHFYHQEFFDRLASCTLSSNTAARISFRTHFYYDAIVIENDQLWEVFNYRDKGAFRREHCPKPDVAFFLPIYDTRATTPAYSSVAFKDKHWQQPPNASMVEPFTWSTLDSLSSHGGLRPGPRSISDKATGANTAAQLRCYPWLIAEFKKAHQSQTFTDRAEEIVRCQASNGAACALQLNQQIARYATPLTDEAHVPPLPTVTTSGSRVTIWIAYYANNVEHDDRFGLRIGPKFVHAHAYIMQAIWTGDMTSLKDVLELQLALENIYTWAIRVFKPLIALYINQWKHVHLQQDTLENMPDTEQMLKNYETAVPMINSLMKKYKTLEFESQQNEHAVNPLHFSLILQQMVLSDHQKLLEGIDDIMTERLQQLFQYSDISRQQSEPDGHSQTASSTGEMDQNANRESTDGLSEEESDEYNPGNSDNEGTQATRASRTAAHQPHLKRSTRSNDYPGFPRQPVFTSDTQQYSDVDSNPNYTRKFRSTTPIDLTADEVGTDTPSGSSFTTRSSLFSNSYTSASTVTTGQTQTAEPHSGISTTPSSMTANRSPSHSLRGSSSFTDVNPGPPTRDLFSILTQTQPGERGFVILSDNIREH